MLFLVPVYSQCHQIPITVLLFLAFIFMALLNRLSSWDVVISKLPKEKLGTIEVEPLLAHNNIGSSISVTISVSHRICSRQVPKRSKPGYGFSELYLMKH